ncbi:MAG: glycosyltransferase [Armatimonadota bacterium]
MRLVLWMNIVSPHQSAVIRALADRVKEVVLVASEEMTADRTAVGWQAPDLGKADVVIAPSKAEISILSRQSPRESVHLLGAARLQPLGKLAFKSAKQAGARIGMISEAADHRGWRGVGRRMKYVAERFTTGQHIDFIFAIGQLGMRWFRQCGYPIHRLFPYAYFVDPLPIMTTPPRRGRAVELIYLGRCAPGKGVETLLQALARCREQDWRLTVVGDGPLRQAWENLTAILLPPSQVDFLQALPNTEARQLLASKDILVLPSDGKEGWGAVVNEALMCGVPVLCSDACGAADLLEDPWRGAVFPAGSISALTVLLDRWIAAGKTTPASRTRIAQWSQCIAGDAAADYVLAVLNHVYNGAARPRPPWLGKETAA